MCATEYDSPRSSVAPTTAASATWGCPRSAFTRGFRSRIYFSSAQKFPPAELLRRKRTAAPKKNLQRQVSLLLPAGLLHRGLAPRRKRSAGGGPPSRARAPRWFAPGSTRFVRPWKGENTSRFPGRRRKKASKQRTSHHPRADRERFARNSGW